MALKTGFKQAFISQVGFFFKDKVAGFSTFLIILALSVVTGWFPDGLGVAVFDGEWKRGLIMMLVSCFIVAFFVYVGVKYYSDLEFDVEEKKPDKKKALLFFLSNVVISKTCDLESFLEDFLKENEGKSLSEIKSRINESPVSRWRMALEAVEYHLPELKKLVLLVSRESFPQVPYFEKFFKSVLPQASEVEVRIFKVDDFDDVEKVFDALKTAYRELYSERLKDRDVIIDVTGGRKPVSIAGALMTVAHPNREFQYVSYRKENGKDVYEVKSYDVRLISRDNV